MKNTVIFDLDGTVLNTIDDLADAVNFALLKNGLPVHSNEKIKSFVGNGIRVLMTRSVPKNCKDEDFEKCYNDFCEYYKDHMEDKTAPYDGITDLLSELKKAGFKTAIVTNKAAFAAEKLCEKMFGNLIDITVGANDSVRHKPYTDSTERALEFLNSKPEDAYFVGDSDVDCKTAKNAGIDFVAVLWGFREKHILENAGATEFAETAEDLKRILMSQNAAESLKT